MFQAETYKGSKEEQYQLVIKQLKALMESETNRIANLSNASALLNQFLKEINWVGFYLYEQEKMNLSSDRFKDCRPASASHSEKGFAEQPQQNEKPSA